MKNKCTVRVSYYDAAPETHRNGDGPTLYCGNCIHKNVCKHFRANDDVKASACDGYLERFSRKIKRWLKIH